MAYGKVYHRFWKSKSVRGWTAEARCLALYLLTCPHATSEGYYYLPTAYMQVDLGWDNHTLSNAMKELDAADFARYDDSAEVVLVVNAVAWNAPKSPTQVKGAANAVLSQPPSPLLSEWRQKAVETCPEIEVHLPAERPPEPASDPYPIDRVSIPSEQVIEASTQLNSAQTEPYGSGGQAAFDVGVPIRKDPAEDSYAATVARWAVSHGHEKPTAVGKSLKYRWLVEVLTVEMPDNAQRRGCVRQVICDYVRFMYDRPANVEELKVVGVALKGHPPTWVFDAVVQGVERAIGLDDPDPKALVLYMRGVLGNQQVAS